MEINNKETQYQPLSLLKEKLDILKDLEKSKSWSERIDKGEVVWNFILLNFIVFTMFGLNPIACLIFSPIYLWLAGLGDSVELSKAKRVYEHAVWKITKENEDIRSKRLGEERVLRSKEAIMTRYKKLRKDIEAMPEYERWRQAVFKEFGRKCRICGSTEKLEIDHRYKSFHAIIMQYGIINTTQAYECAALWEVNNGGVLCKTHHDQTTSSIYRQLKSVI